MADLRQHAQRLREYAADFPIEDGLPEEAAMASEAADALDAAAGLIDTLQEALNRAEVGLENARGWFHDLPHYEAQDTSLFHYGVQGIELGTETVLAQVRGALSVVGGGH